VIKRVLCMTIPPSMSRDNLAASNDFPQEFRLMRETISGASL